MAKKPKSPPLRNRAEFDLTADRYAELDTQKRQLEAKRDEAIQAVQNEHNPAINQLADEMKQLLAQAETFATVNRKELFPGEEKTVHTALTKVTLRISPGALKPLSKAWTDEAILMKVKELLGEQFVRTAEEINKDLIKAEYGDDSDKLASVGLKLLKPENFDITPKVEVVEPAA